MDMTGFIGGYGFSLFFPIILKDSLQFSEELSFILAAPPVIFAVLVGGTFAWLADKTHLRGPYVFVQEIISIAGFCMIGFLHRPVPRFIGKLFGIPALDIPCLHVNLPLFGEYSSP